MTDLEKAGLAYQLSNIFDRLNALERLAPPKGSDSGDLLPDTRSGAGDKSTKSDGSEKPLPDQGWGGMASLIDYLEDEAASYEDEGDRTEFESDESGRLSFEKAAVFRRWVAMLNGMLPRTQSVADGDEVEAAIKTALACLRGMAAACDQAAEVQENHGIPDGAKASRTKAAACRDAFQVLESLLTELSRKERSVSGNDQRNGAADSGPPQQ